MKSENFTIQNSLEGNYLSVRLQEPVQLDEIAVKVMKQDCPDFLIPFRIVEINDSVSLRYKLMDMVALEYADRKLRKTEFIRLYRNLLVPFIKGNDWFLDYHNLCIDSRYIFIDKTSTSAYFIYIPEYSYRNTDEEVFQFLRDAFTQITITDDPAFQVRLFQYFMRQEMTLTDLYQMMQEEDRKLGSGEKSTVVNIPKEPDQINHSMKEYIPVDVVPTHPKKEAPMTGEMTEKKAPVSGALPEGDGGEDEVIRALFGQNKDRKKGKEKKQEKDKKKEKEKKDRGFGAFFQKNEKSEGGKAEEKYQKEQRHSSDRADEKINNHGQGWYPESSSVEEVKTEYGSAAEEETEIIGGEIERKPYLELIDSPLPGAFSRIELDFTTAYIIIGRASSDEVQPDVAFHKEFTRISRRHARIEKRENGYFVIDLGAANHTILNGRVLIPNQPYQLEDGGELAFSDSKSIRYRIHL